MAFINFQEFRADCSKIHPMPEGSLGSSLEYNLKKDPIVFSGQCLFQTREAHMLVYGETNFFGNDYAGLLEMIPHPRTWATDGDGANILVPRQTDGRNLGCVTRTLEQITSCLGSNPDASELLRPIRDSAVLRVWKLVCKEYRTADSMDLYL